MSESDEWSPRVLVNSGVPVKVLLLDPNTGAPVVDGDGDPVTTTKRVKYDFNSLAEVEEMFGSFTGWQSEIRERPTVALRKLLGAAWGVSPQEAGKVLIPDEQPNYLEAVMTAFSIANGTDPITALEGTRALLAAAKDIVETAADQVRQALTGVSPPASDSQQRGSDQEAPSPS